MSLVSWSGFGTSNSTIGINLNGKAQLVPLEFGEQRLRSAIFYHSETRQLIFGERDVLPIILMASQAG